MNTSTLDELVYECLKTEAGKRMSGREIAAWIRSWYPEWCEAKRTRSKAAINPLDTDDKLMAQIAAEIGARHGSILQKYPLMRVTGSRPRLYYYSEASDEQELAAAEAAEIQESTRPQGQVPAPTDSPPRLAEKDLYPLLARYLIDELKVWSLRIDETKSSNRQGPSGNKWLFPDLVGLEDLTAEWPDLVRRCVEEQPETRTKLWSFEVKLLINRSNVREVFFQTVSNSSWANLAYLVAAELTGDETLKELRRLASLHGIGVMLLDIENPAESQILIPARERAPVDWNTVSRIADENPDFRTYVELITDFYKLGKIKDKEWYTRPTV